MINKQKRKMDFLEISVDGILLLEKQCVCDLM